MENDLGEEMMSHMCIRVRKTTFISPGKVLTEMEKLKKEISHQSQGKVPMGQNCSAPELLEETTSASEVLDTFPLASEVLEPFSQSSEIYQGFKD